MRNGIYSLWCISRFAWSGFKGIEIASEFRDDLRGVSLFRVSDGSNFESTKKQITFPVDGDYHFLLLRLKKSLFSNNFQYDLINFLLATLFDRKRSNRKPEQSRLYLLSMWFLLDICVDNSKCCVLLIRILVFSQSEAEFNINDSQRTRV